LLLYPLSPGGCVLNKFYAYGAAVIAVLLAVIKFLLSRNKNLKEEIRLAKKQIEFRAEVDDLDTEIDQEFSHRAEEARRALADNRIPDHLR